MADFVRSSEEQSREALQQFLWHCSRYSASSGDPAESIARDHCSASTRSSATSESVTALRQLGAAFARLPYENLTKIIRAAETGNVVEARRLPAEVLDDHRRWGTGGTCFSLTWTLLHLVRALGFRAEPILADRHYGADTHCALLVWIDNVPHLLDPGYLLVDPMPLPCHGEVVVPTAFNEVKLEVQGERLALHTIQHGRITRRLEYKPQPVDTTAFLKVWDESFEWEMMTYPIVSTVAAGRQLYLQKNQLLVRDRERSERSELAEQELVTTISREFSIAAEVVQKAVELLRRQGVR